MYSQIEGKFIIHKATSIRVWRHVAAWIVNVWCTCNELNIMWGSLCTTHSEYQQHFTYQFIRMVVHLRRPEAKWNRICIYIHMLDVNYPTVSIFQCPITSHICLTYTFQWVAVCAICLSSCCHIVRCLERLSQGLCFSSVDWVCVGGGWAWAVRSASRSVCRLAYVCC